MAEYKEGDLVLIAVKVKDVRRDCLVVQYPHALGDYALGFEHIRGLVPRPPTDWSKVEFGARVRNIRGGWVGRFLERNKDGALYVWANGSFASFCPEVIELIEE